MIQGSNRIVSRGFTGTWEELGTYDLPPAAAVFVRDHAEGVRAAWTHATSERETLVASVSRADDDLVTDMVGNGLAIAHTEGSSVQVVPATAARAPHPGRLWLLTSGSTGRPKRVAHTLTSLTTVKGDQPARTWLCPYTPGAYAWWQVVTLALAHPGNDIVFVEPDQLEDWPQLALETGVTAASGTPTFWRQAILRSGDTMAQLPLVQITLGGEPVDQGILDRLHEIYPQARISWIYASSEAGASIAVHDGRAGFPEAWLERQTGDRPRLSVVDDELVIESPYRAEGMDRDLHTGDRIEVRDGRVLIVGRLASDEINVGGSKASASAVRGALLDHPAVAWAAVRGRKAPLVGHMVTAEVVLEPGATATTEELAAWCAERLPEYAVPRRLKILAQIPIKESLKSDV
ncbi:Acyl-CoA synthetase (AMP-forming)/AMP-acid ligase II [Raineyella antarctica]|uniref:Acyl-CoA synthetase (AMP-forming)/AMP-acid ligase II n=1 Tax=Raineyella antarctica TaxID=1577474 RepID=A0A1G6GHF6_9ACTN|nr:AMP-binding protein [Raineyella antarctica]SDB80616.1 Acyl-CoA synthetase (AMP-forming)/AMP-acid ligase II [Raineyella antarctica]